MDRLNEYGPYFDTTALDNMRAAVARARTQNEKIMAWFTVFGEGSPSQAAIALPGAPLTSVRRAITTLERNGKLVKTQRQRQGAYGRPEHVWAVPAQGELF